MNPFRPNFLVLLTSGRVLLPEEGLHEHKGFMNERKVAFLLTIFRNIERKLICYVPCVAANKDMHTHIYILLKLYWGPKKGRQHFTQLRISEVGKDQKKNFFIFMEDINS